MWSLSDKEEAYVISILGQRTPLELANNQNPLLVADSLWNRGQEVDHSSINGLDSPFATGLRHLLDGRLLESYECFVEASKASQKSENNGLMAVFFAERAVNIAFWMASPEKMVQACQHLDEAWPFAAGVIAFARYMNGELLPAEEVARGAIDMGKKDPWTIHAVIHSLYAQGKINECLDFLNELSPTIREGMPSTFMKVHFEFHRALCYIKLRKELELSKLVKGDLWNGLSMIEQQDYWTSAGLLNALWKAELNGLEIDTAFVGEALSFLLLSDPAKSMVFSLCILRWTKGEERSAWSDALKSSRQLMDHAVFPSMMNVIESVYGAEGTISFHEAGRCDGLHFISEDLDSLGASPEQREVLEDFMSVATLRSKSK